MGYVSAEYPDIFISYAHVDDAPDPGEDEGWVTTLVRFLKNQLAKKLGREDCYELWMDHQLPGNAVVTPEIDGKVKNSAVIVILLSQGYLKSPWCGREMILFLEEEVRRRRGTTSGLLVVEIDKVERPQALADLLGYRFWVEDTLRNRTRTLNLPRKVPTEDQYYQRLDDLARDLVAELNRRRPAEIHRDPASNVKPPPRSEPLATVYLAEVTEDLEDQRDEVKRYLIQAGYQVVPQSYYSRAPEVFRRDARKDLERSSLCVQLLSGLAGPKLADDQPSAVAIQWECAGTLNKPIMQWRSRDLDVVKAAARNQAHGALLTGPDCLALGLEEFKALVVARLEAERLKALSERNRQGPDPDRDLGRLVFVNAEEVDLPLARSVGEALAEWGVWCAFPRTSGSPAELREDLEQKLLDCDALMLIYGSTKVTWVSQQLRRSRKVMCKHEPPPPAIGVYLGPPEPKEPLDVMIPKLRVIESQSGLNRDALQDFLDAF